MLKDISYALRIIRGNPGITAVAVLTLALGIGANTAMFSVVNAVLLRTLPYQNAEQLVTIPAQIPSLNLFGAYVEYNTYAEWWRAQSRSFQSMSAYTPVSVNLTSASEPERLFAHRVCTGFLAMIGVHPALGRDFLAGDDQPVGMVMGRALLLGSAGVALGVAGGLALTRLLRSMLYEVSATDPAVFVSVSLFLLAVVALAGYFPARRAARVDPTIALHHE